MMVLLLEKKTCLMHSRAREKCLLDYPQFRPSSTAPPLLGKILENKEAGEAGVRTGKGNQTELAA